MFVSSLSDWGGGGTPPHLLSRHHKVQKHKVHFLFFQKTKYGYFPIPRDFTFSFFTREDVYSSVICSSAQILENGYVLCDFMFGVDKVGPGRRT